MKTKRVRRAIGAFVLTTCYVIPAQAMESEYRPYEPSGRHDHPTVTVPLAGSTRTLVPLKDFRRPTNPTFRTGDGSHPRLVPHLSRDIRPGAIPMHDTGDAGFPVWRW